MVRNNRRTCNVRERTVRKYGECNATKVRFRHMSSWIVRFEETLRFVKVSYIVPDQFPVVGIVGPD